MTAITRIIIHCADTKNGAKLGAVKGGAAAIIDKWHGERDFQRASSWRTQLNPHLYHIGYQFVIDTDGLVETGRAIGEVGAHTYSYNRESIGICLIGRDKFTIAQWQQLKKLIDKLHSQYPNATIYGHHEFNKSKKCPCFDVPLWVRNGCVPDLKNIFMGE